MTKLLIKLFIKDADINSQRGRELYGRLAGAVGIICNLLLSVMKLIIGSISNSVSITADATNNIADAGSSIVTLVGFRLSGKPADKDHPYGHARIEYISSLIISFLILLIGCSIFKESVTKIFKPEESLFNVATVVVLVASIIVKLWLSIFNKFLGKQINSKALEATAIDSRNDVITTTAVLIASTISHFTGFNLDGYMGLVVSVFIFISGINLVKETLDPLLGQPPTKEMFQTIEQKILSYDNVLGVHDLMVHSYGPNTYFASAHIEMDAKIDVLVCHDIMDQIERDFKSELNIHLVVHLDPTILDSPEINELKEMVNDIICEIDRELTFHDFRVVIGEENKNVLFDVVVPPEYKYSDEELEKIITNKITEVSNGKIFTVLVVDHSYGVLE
ncbi:MAG: cation transporter [Clostridia bacterium]|nr:cation transporter [Clostridia bacterium]MBR3809338.1 cation transporter [Clostridia bacterium]